jgi:hypothetical protein
MPSLSIKLAQLGEQRTLSGKKRRARPLQVKLLAEITVAVIAMCYIENEELARIAVPFAGNGLEFSVIFIVRYIRMEASEQTLVSFV